MRSRICVVLCALFVHTARAADLTFVEVSAERGIGSVQTAEGHGSGLAVVDFDNDGFLDIFVPQAGGVPNSLYHNLGDGSFEDIAADVGLASTASARCALWLDYDADGDLDLVIANDDTKSASSFTLYRQGADGMFEDVTVEAGLFKPPLVLFFNHHWSPMCAGDINNDGFIDLFSGQYPFGPGHLFLNSTAGGFEDISASSGLPECTTGIEPGCTSAHQCVMADFNSDGWTDIYLAVDLGPDAAGRPNQLWINQHDNTFVDTAAAAGLDNAMDDMGIALGDYDNDGDLDVYVTNIFQPGEYNVLFRNETSLGKPNFVDVSASMAVQDGDYGWGTTFLDADLDGDLDLAATNGWRSGVWVTDKSRFFSNQGAGQLAFTETSTAVQFDDTEWGSALLAADVDRDGDQELLQLCMTRYDQGQPVHDGQLRLLDNTVVGPRDPGHYLVVKPRQFGPNRMAIGALVRATVGVQTMTRLISAGSSYMGQEPAEAFFGLGDASTAESLVVEWPDGTTTTLTDLAGQPVLTLTHCVDVRECADLDGDAIRDDGCVWWACENGLCAGASVVYADFGGGNGACPPDGAADGNDRFHALNCFSNQTTQGTSGYPCAADPPAAFNVDVAGLGAPCAPDGVCDGNDAFAALNAFSGTSTCSCGPGPAPGAEPTARRRRSAP